MKTGIAKVFDMDPWGSINAWLSKGVDKYDQSIFYFLMSAFGSKADIKK